MKWVSFHMSPSSQLQASNMGGRISGVVSKKREKTNNKTKGRSVGNVKAGIRIQDSGKDPLKGVVTVWVRTLSQISRGERFTSQYRFVSVLSPLHLVN
jgi:hypothetical protein